MTGGAANRLCGCWRCAGTNDGGGSIVSKSTYYRHNDPKRRRTDKAGGGGAAQHGGVGGGCAAARGGEEVAQPGEGGGASPGLAVPLPHRGSGSGAGPLRLSHGGASGALGDGGGDVPEDGGVNGVAGPGLLPSVEADANLYAGGVRGGAQPMGTPEVDGGGAATGDAVLLPVGHDPGAAAEGGLPMPPFIATDGGVLRLPVGNMDGGGPLLPLVGGAGSGAAGATWDSSDDDSNDELFVDDAASDDDGPMVPAAVSAPAEVEILAPLPGHGAATNQVLLPVEQFREIIGDLWMYCMSVDHHLTRPAVTDLLRARSTRLQYRTPYKLQRAVDASVKLHELKVDACINGCVAFTAKRQSSTVCDYCGEPRYQRGSTAARYQVTYWPLTPWLTGMLADPVLSVQLTAGMRKARERATEPQNGFSDWYDGSNFRDSVQRGYFSADTDVALSLSTDGFDPWRQNGFQAWPIIATILNFDPECRARVVNQLLLCVTPGPDQPADLESFLHPIMQELNILATGVDEVAVAGEPGSRTLRAFVTQFTADMPAGDKLLNATGHNGHQPNRFRAFSGVYYKNHTYYPPTNPITKESLFAIRDCATPRRTAGADG